MRKRLDILDRKEDILEWIDYQNGWGDQYH